MHGGCHYLSRSALGSGRSQNSYPSNQRLMDRKKFGSGTMVDQPKITKVMIFQSLRDVLFGAPYVATVRGVGVTAPCCASLESKPGIFHHWRVITQQNSTELTAELTRCHFGSSFCLLALDDQGCKEWLHWGCLTTWAPELRRGSAAADECHQLQHRNQRLREGAAT